MNTNDGHRAIHPALNINGPEIPGVDDIETPGPIEIVDATSEIPGPGKTASLEPNDIEIGGIDTSAGGSEREISECSIEDRRISGSGEAIGSPIPDDPSSSPERPIRRPISPIADDTAG